MVFRFVHTADWQIGMRAAHVGGVAERVREARFEAAERVVELSSEHQVDALVLAGDTFEDTDIPRPLVQRVVDLLRRSRAPVFVLPANHDPLVPHGVFAHPAWAAAEPKVRVLRTNEPVAAGAAVLLPCPLRQRSSFDDPTHSIPSAESTGRTIRVGVAHGSLRDAGAPNEELVDDFPIDRDCVRRARLDYLALGHWHTPSRHEVEGVIRVAYCGSHEPTKFGEQSEAGRSGECLLVEIEGPGVEPRLHPLRTAVLDWRQTRREVRSRDEVDRLREELDGESDVARTSALLHLELEGTLDLPDAARLIEIAELASARFLFARVDQDRVLLRPADTHWVGALPSGVPQAVARRLLDEAASGSPDARTARAALDCLFDLASEARR